MRVLHLSNDLYPLVTGGTEIFVQQLIGAQRLLQPRPQLLWAAHRSPALGHAPPTHHRVSEFQRLLPAVLSGGRLQLAAATAAGTPGFQELLDDFQPDLVHLHSFSDRCGMSHARAVKASGARLVVTVHAPGFSCIKGNLIDASGVICDGQLRPRRCTCCRLHNGGLPRWLAALVAVQRGWPLGPEVPGRLAHVFTARQLTTAFQQAWLELSRLADAIHVLASWSRDVLLRQGIPSSKVHLIRSAGPVPLPPRLRRPMQDGVLRLVFWGRCHPVKGLDLLVDAIQSLPFDVPLQLDLYGPGWTEPYGQQLMLRIGADPRFCLQGNLPKDQLLPLLQGYDLAVVPSTWLETGPLTVLEAFAAGLPVAGSDLGGIREWLLGVPGCWLLPPEAHAWGSLLLQLLSDPSSLVSPPAPQRTFDQLASELLPLYGVRS